jgi:hypothetical protein
MTLDLGDILRVITKWMLLIPDWVNIFCLEYGNKTSSAVNNASLHVQYSVLICMLRVCMLCHSHETIRSRFIDHGGNANARTNIKLSYFMCAGNQQNVYVDMYVCLATSPSDPRVLAERGVGNTPTSYS